MSSSPRIPRQERRDFSKNSSNSSRASSHASSNRRSARLVSAGPSSYQPKDEDDGNNNNEMPLLDLHGYQERPAIRALAEFFEQHKNKNNNNNAHNRHINHGTWVRILTGTGSHSFGPILRPAVQSLLERRQMTFTIDTPESFCVDAASGVTFYGSCTRRRHRQPESRIQVVSGSNLPADEVVVVGRPISVIPSAATGAAAAAAVAAEDAAENSSNSPGAQNTASTNSHHRNNVRLARQVSSDSHSSEDNKNEMPLLDLQGFRERPAIRALTDFLEQHKYSSGSYNRNRINNHGTWVRIITGTSHSFGPILRPAVQSLLERRQMVFVVDTPSSFCVDAASGVSFVGTSARGRHRQLGPPIQVRSSNDLPADGVVVVGRPICAATVTATETVSAEEATSAPTASCECRMARPSHSTSLTGTGMTGTKSSRRSASSIVNSWWKHLRDEDPRQNRSNPEMEQAAQAREASLAEAAAASSSNSAKALNNDDLEEVLELSRKEYEQRRKLGRYVKGRSIDDEDADLGQALALSRNEYEQQVVQEEAALQEALSLSKQQEEAERQREEKLLQVALQESQQEMRINDAKAARKKEVMLKAVPQKPPEQEAKDNGIENGGAALAKSLEETQRRKRAAEEEEERILQQVMQMSLEYQY